MSTLVKPVGRFIRHLLGMCAAMCIGLAALDAAFFGLARILGYANPLVELPELSTLIIAFNMALPMAIWMRFRRMAWEPIWEMSAAMLALAILLIAAFWLGLITAGPRGLFGWQHGLMLPAMVIPMLFRLDLYTGRASHTARAPAAVAVHEDTARHQRHVEQRRHRPGALLGPTGDADLRHSQAVTRGPAHPISRAPGEGRGGGWASSTQGDAECRN